MRRALSFAAIATVLVAVSPGCSQGEGDGHISGTLNVPNCWSGAFDLAPDFFAANPYREGLQIRIQSGSDFETYSDGVSILVYDIGKIRPDPSSNSPGKYGQPIPVELPPEVTPPGVPIRPQPDPPLVAMTVYLQKSCRTQDVTLQAVEEVTLPNDGSCTANAVMGADPTQGCAPDKESPAGLGSGKSLITFTHVANGKLDEPTAAERLTAGCFDVYLADPRDAPPGASVSGAPPNCRGHIKGSFSFFFERGRPAQPFPNSP